MTRGTAASRALAALALAPTLALVALALAAPILSGDLWWHVRAGQWMLEHGALPDTDPFSHTAGDRHWILQEYLSQVVFALVHGAAGLAGLKALGVALGIAVLVAVFRFARRRVDPVAAAALTALFALLYALKWELRPHLVSTLLFLALARVAFGEEDGGPPGPRRALVVLALSCAWVQLHAEALFAPIVLLAGVIAAVLTRLQGGPNHVGRWLLLFGASVLGTLLYPLGWEPHAYALFHRAVPQEYIEEWFRPWVRPGDPRFVVISQPVFWTYWVCAFVGALHLARQGLGRLANRADAASWFRLGFLGVCLLMSLQARRFLWLAWFPVLDLVATHAASRLRAPVGRTASVAVAVGAAALLLGTHYVALARDALGAGQYGRDVDPRLFPVAAAELVRDAGLGGNLYHPYEWGGYLGFALGDANPVYVDGRTVLFEDVIPERWLAERDPALLARLVDERDVRVIVFDRLAERDGALAPWAAPAGWVLAWSDDLARVWVRPDVPLDGLRRHYDALGVGFDGRFVEAMALDAGWEFVESRRVFASPVLAALRDAPDDAGRAQVFEAFGMRRNAEWLRARSGG